MKSITKRRLKKILFDVRDVFPLANICADDTSLTDLLGYKNTGPIPLNEAIDIYQRRFEHTKSMKNEIPGFEKLMKALRKENAKSIIVHMFSGKKFSFYVFSDKSVSRLIGILKFSLEK